MNTFICQRCQVEFSSRVSGRKFCSNECYWVDKKGKKKLEGFGEKVSKALKGKPRPWALGENNPNFGNKAQQPYREKLLMACRERGSTWGEEDCKKHSERMKGSSNWMTGKNHTEDTKKFLSEKQKERHEKGFYRKSSKISFPERVVLQLLRSVGFSVEHQFQIPGVRYHYDFFIPSKNMVVEFYGNYWHANPKFYPPGTFLRIKNSGEFLVDEIWEKDKQRIAVAENRGYLTAIIWESDFNEGGLPLVMDKILGVP